MKQTLNRLNAKKLAAVKEPLEPGLHADGGSLYFKVDRRTDGSSGAKRWVFIYHLPNRREISLGAYPAVTLERARKLAQAAREQLARGNDPKALRDAERQPAKVVTFRDHYAVVLEAKRPTWKGDSSVNRWGNALAHCSSIGDLPVRAVDTAAVCAVLRPIWWTISEMALKVRAMIEDVMASAVVEGLHPGPNPAVWRGHLDAVFHEQPKLTRGSHAAMDHTAVPAFLTSLREREGYTARCLELVVLTGARSSEAREARWSEFDLVDSVWCMPRERCKEEKALKRAKLTHKRIALSDAAVDLLTAIREEQDGWRTYSPAAHLWPMNEAGEPFSYNGMRAVLLKMGLGAKATVHGFRSSFRDWAAEQKVRLPAGRKVQAYTWEACEIALGHTVGDATTRAYFRGDLLEERRDLMRDWADYCMGRVRAPASEAQEATFLRFLAAHPDVAASYVGWMAERV